MATLSNATARKHFLHAADTHGDTGERCCFFSQNGDVDGWGFWVLADGTVDTDTISSNGEMPSSRVVEACVRAAVKYLAK